MPRYFDIEKLAEMARAKADTLLPEGKVAFLSVAKWLELLPAADVVPRSEADKLEYTLLGVMHCVDKWLDGDELEQDEVNRAITMRENTLRIVENLQAEVERLNGELIVESTRRKNAVIAYHSAKQEVAREIFEEIEKCMAHDYISTIGVYNGALELRIAELKMKYSEVSK